MIFRRLLGSVQSKLRNAMADGLQLAANSDRRTQDGRTAEPRTYSVTVVAQRASRGASRIEIGETTWASSFRHDKTAFLVEVPVQAERALDAYQQAYKLVTQFLRLLGTEGVGYRIGDHDERVELRVLAEGPEGPRIDSYSQSPFATGGEYTLSAIPHSIITTFELNSTHTVQADTLAHIFQSRDQWPETLRDALALHWEGQCSHDHNVKFALSVSALQVLVDATNPRQSLFSQRFTPTARRQLKSRISQLLVSTEKLEEAQIQRACDSVLRTDDVSTSERFTTYLNMHLQLAGRPSFHALTAREVADLLQQRGRYVHAGKPGDEELLGQRWELIARVGRCLGNETSKYAQLD